MRGSTSYLARAVQAIRSPAARPRNVACLHTKAPLVSSHPFRHAVAGPSILRQAGRVRYASSATLQPVSSARSRLLRPTTLILIFVPILTGFLGVWQIKRLQWKVALIDEVERNLKKAPMTLPNNINLSALPEFTFRRVVVRGTLSGPPILMGPQVKDGVPGYSLILPLHRPGGSSILLNRGFITTTRAQAIRAGTDIAPGLRPDGSGEEVEVEGMLFKPGEKGFWTVENNTATNEWFWRDVEAMAEWCGGAEKGVQPVMVDALDYGEHPSSYLMQQGIPVGRLPEVDIRNQHASYAVTWFSLSAATSAMLFFVLRKGRGGPKIAPRRSDL